MKDQVANNGAWIFVGRLDNTGAKALWCLDKDREVTTRFRPPAKIFGETA